MTTSSAYGNKPVKQHGVRLINFIFNKKHFKTRFHIVDINQEKRNLARCDSKVVDKCTKCTNENFLNQNGKMRTQLRLRQLMSLESGWSQ